MKTVKFILQGGEKSYTIKFPDAFGDYGAIFNLVAELRVHSALF